MSIKTKRRKQTIKGITKRMTPKYAKFSQKALTEFVHRAVPR